MSSSNTGCITGVITGFSRIMVAMMWLARPVAWNAAFGSFIVPCLGFLFLPFTTLMYVFLVQGGSTIQGLDWLWLIIAVVVDLASLGAAGAANRDKLPAGVPGSTSKA